MNGVAFLQAAFFIHFGTRSSKRKMESMVGYLDSTSHSGSNDAGN